MASTYGRGIWNYPLVTAPTFTNVISNSPQTIFPTQTAMSNGTLTAEDGYSSPVNLSCTGAAPATCTLQPTQVTLSGNPTATYTLTAGGTVGDYNFDAHAVGTDPKAVTVDAVVTQHVVDFNFDGTKSEFVDCRARRNLGSEHVAGDGVGQFCGNRDTELLVRAADRCGVRVFAIEFGESDVLFTSDGDIDGDGGGRDSGGWSSHGDDFRDDGGSSRGQDADLQFDGDQANS